MQNCSSGYFGGSWRKFAFGDPSQALINDGGFESGFYPDEDIGF